ncbi:MAG: phosphotransferase [Halobacteriovoraceae bacterium]|nr:phosphotransferase [Halobacteriovoraceae bacterium]
MKLEQSERLFVETLITENMQNIQIDDIQKLTGDASTRRYYRVYTKAENFVACLDSPIEEDIDPNFVVLQKVLKENNVRVPNIFFRDNKKGFILEEDLGDETFLSRLAKIKTLSEELELYKKAIDLLVDIHSIETNNYEKDSFVRLRFDEEKLMSEVRLSNEYFLRKYLNITDEILVKEIEDIFKNICKKIQEKQVVLTHRDYHSRNIMMSQNQFVVIDFQDARMGIPQYDLVSLLDDSYYRIDPTNKSELREYYWKLREKKLSSFKSAQEFEQFYNYMMLQRTYKAIGSFCYIFEKRNDARYLKYISCAFENIKSVLFKLDEFSDLKTPLFKLYYES